MTKTRKRRTRKRKVERTISNGRRKSNASLFGPPGWLGASTTTTLVIGGDCERTASAMSSPTTSGRDETMAGCDLMTDECGIGDSPMAGCVGMDEKLPWSSLVWIKIRK
jgi:hypothetical protein